MPSAGITRRLALAPPRASAPASAASPGDSSSAGQQFSQAFYRTRLLTFAAMFVGYGSYYLTRNSLSYVAPTLLNDKAIGLTMTQIGGLTSILPVCYGVRLKCSIDALLGRLSRLPITVAVPVSGWLAGCR